MPRKNAQPTEGRHGTLRDFSKIQQQIARRVSSRIVEIMSLLYLFLVVVRLQENERTFNSLAI